MRLFAVPHLDEDYARLQVRTDPGHGAVAGGTGGLQKHEESDCKFRDLDESILNLMSVQFKTNQQGQTRQNSRFEF